MKYTFNKSLIRAFFTSLLLTSCASKSAYQKEPELTSVQVMDRNGFAETISSKERLSNFKKVDFATPQPYQKVLRVYGKNKEGKTHSIITSYHDNGHIWQSLEVTDGRAHGVYKEWHANGNQKLEAHVIEGIADLHETAQASWLFDGKNSVWDEETHRIAEINYEKGVLEGPSIYYHTNGLIWKEVPFHNNEMQGTFTAYNDQGILTEKSLFDKGIKVGNSVGFWEADKPSFIEEYTDKGLLSTASYYNKDGAVLSEIKEGFGFLSFFEEGYLQAQVEYKSGIPYGLVKNFDKEGNISSTYRIKQGKKEGEEIIYYSTNPRQPKISLQWHEDALQGPIKTWYENGTLESERELNGNKKEGMSLAWYKNGALMLMEEYEGDILTKGSYYKKKHKKPVSIIENGKGLATLFDGEGNFLKKVPYEKGKPLLTTPEKSLCR